MQKSQSSWVDSIERHLARQEPRYFLLLGALIVLCFWGPRILWGFWLDEAGTFWMARGGWLAAAQKCWRWPGQSILYGMIESLFCTRGRFMEFLLRVPSVIAAIAAAFLLYKAAERLAGRGAGYLAAVPFLCAPSVVIAATSARPYALALAASIGSFWKLHEWVEEQRRSDLFWYVAFSILTIYLHYFFAFIFVVHLLYLLCRALTGKSVAWKQAAVAAAVLAMSLLPLAGHIRLLVGQAHTLSFAPRPGLMDTLYISLPLESVYGAFLGYILALLFSSTPLIRSGMASRPAAFLAGLWLFAGPVVFCAVSRFTSHQIFLERYLLFALPAFFLFLGSFLLGLRPASARLIAVCAIAAFAVNTNHLRKSFQPGPEEWRAPLAILRSIPAGGDVPVFVRSGLVESTYKDWKAGLDPNSYLFAPLTAYPIPNTVIPLPYGLNDEARRQITDTVQRLSGTPRFALVALGDAAVIPWMKEYMASQGFRNQTWRPNLMQVILFEK